MGFLETKKKYKGLWYYVIVQEMGHRCGYVKIPESNFFYKINYRDIMPNIDFSMLESKPIGKRGIIDLFCFDGENIRMGILFDVHGGVTYSQDHLWYTMFQITFKNSLKRKLKITKKAKGWYLGFDCNHFRDRPDPSLAGKNYKEYATRGMGTIRNNEYVQNECMSFIEQIIEYDKLLKENKTMDNKEPLFKILHDLGDNYSIKDLETNQEYSIDEAFAEFDKDTLVEDYIEKEDNKLYKTNSGEPIFEIIENKEE